MLKGLNWRIFRILFVAGLLGVLAVLPLAFALIESGTFGEKATTNIPLPLVIALALLQNGVLLAIVIAIGMILSERIGLQMPLIRAWANGTRLPNASGIVLPGFLVGAATGVVLVVSEAIYFLKRLPNAMLSLFDVPLWKRLLGGVVYGGITEELLMRLFLVSLIAWLLGKFMRTSDGMPTHGAFWIAIILVACVFALGHLPATAAITPLTQLLVARTLVLNGIAGIAFGGLYWRYGLEAAMVGHMSTHLVMQGPGVMLLKNLL